MTNPLPGEAGKASRGTLYMLMARMVLLACGFFISIILARKLGPEQFGVYGVVMSVLVWLERLVSAGVPGATAAMLSRHNVPIGMEQAARVMLLAWSLVLLVACWLVAPLIADYFGMPEDVGLFRLAMANLPFMGVFFAYDGIFNGRRDFAAQASLVSIQSVTKLAGILLLFIVGFSVKGAFTAHVLATLVMAVYALVRYPPTRVLPSRGAVRTLAITALPLGVFDIALFVVLSLSLWQLKADWRGPAAAVGFFVVGLNLTRMLLVVPATVTGVMYAFLSRAFAAQDRAQMRRYVHGAVRFTLLVTAPASVLLTLEADGIVTLLYGEAYRQAATIFAILTLAFCGVAFLDIFFRMLQAAGRIHMPMTILIGLIAVLMLLDGWWIPAAGGDGAATALAVTVWLGAVAGGVLAWRLFGSLLALRTLLRIVAACLLLAVLAWSVPAHGLWLLVKLGALSIVYGLTLIALGEVTWADIKPLLIRKAAAR